MGEPPAVRTSVGGLGGALNKLLSTRLRIQSALEGSMDPLLLKTKAQIKTVDILAAVCQCHTLID